MRAWAAAARCDAASRRSRAYRQCLMRTDAAKQRRACMTSLTDMGRAGVENIPVVERRTIKERKTACNATAQDTWYDAMFLDTRCPLKYRYVVVATATRANDASILARFRVTPARMRASRSKRAQCAESRRAAVLSLRRKDKLCTCVSKRRPKWPLNTFWMRLMQSVRRYDNKTGAKSNRVT